MAQPLATDQTTFSSEESQAEDYQVPNLLDVGSISARRRMSRPLARNLTTINGVCFAPPLTRRCPPSTGTRYRVAVFFDAIPVVQLPELLPHGTFQL